ncbi:MAG: hypothetical protein ABJA78_19685 [Ferruginibacter sp.]
MSNLPTGPQPEDTISLEDGVTITTNWRDFIGPIMASENYIRAFYIPIDDITSLAAFHQVKAVRAYLALEDVTDPSTLKLAMVPVDDDGKDILFCASEIAGKQSAIYDFTSPCPQSCDVDSPLFTGDI